MDINFGLQSYTKLKYMIRIAKLLKYMKKQERLLTKTEDPYMHLKYLNEIKRIRQLALKKFEALKKYSATHKP
jgi:hypothetical protein